MNVELKSVLEYLGVDASIKTMDEFKTSFEKDHVKISAIKDMRESNPELKKVFDSVTAPILGKAENKLKGILKEAGLTFEQGELKDKGFEDIANIGLEKIKAKVAELEGKLGQTNDAAVKEWQDKYSKIEKTYHDTKGLLEKTANEYDSFKANSANELKNFKLEIVDKEAISKLKLKGDVKPIELIGFKTLLKESYIKDFDEAGNVVIKDKEGKLIPSKAKSGAFKTLDEVYIEEATKAGIIDANGNGGRTVFSAATPPQPSQPPQNIKPTVATYINPRAMGG